MSEQIPDTLAELAVPIDSVRPYPGNPRRGDVDAIARSLSRNGQYRPIVVNRATGDVLAGNHTREAAVQLGWTRIAATFVDVDDDQAARIVAVDNRASDLATNDDETLLNLLRDLDDLDGTGYTDDDLALLAAVLAPPSLDDLAAKHGDPADDDLWPVLRFKVSPAVRDDFYELTDDATPDNDDAGRFAWLIRKLRATA